MSPRTQSSHQSDVAGSGSPQHFTSADFATDKASKSTPDKKSPQQHHLSSDNKAKRDSGAMSGVAVPEKIEEVAEPPE